jgi:hypothetical protein
MSNQHHRHKTEWSEKFGRRADERDLIALLSPDSKTREKNRMKARHLREAAERLHSKPKAPHD